MKFHDSQVIALDKKEIPGRCRVGEGTAAVGRYQGVGIRGRILKEQDHPGLGITADHGRAVKGGRAGAVIDHPAGADPVIGHKVGVVPDAEFWIVGDIVEAKFPAVP